MITKAIIAAAGRGTRMGKLGLSQPKHLIPVNGKPFLYYLLKNLKEAGITDAIMIIGYKKELMEEYLKSWANDLNLTIVNQAVVGGEKYGTAIPLMCAHDFLDSEDFLSVNGDNLYSVTDLKRMLDGNGYNYIGGLFHENPERYGVLSVDNEGFLKTIVEKPQEPVGNLINTGLYKFTPKVWDKLSQIKLSPRGEYEITDVINLLAQDHLVKVQPIEDYWLDFGRPEDIEKVSKFLTEEENEKNFEKNPTY